MNKDIIKGKWHELKGDAKTYLGKITDDELDKAEGESEKLIGLLQKHYGYTKHKAEQEYNKFASRHQDTH